MAGGTADDINPAAPKPYAAARIPRVLVCFCF